MKAGAKAGSSPRVWGQVPEQNEVVKAHWIIPTRMGTSCSGLTKAYQIQDHPHAYGDKINKKRGVKMDLGSSPRVWGQVCVSYTHKERGRIIPTRMGTSCQFVNANAGNGDHPHAYGDKIISKERCNDYRGSSPRVWGQD